MSWAKISNNARKSNNYLFLKEKHKMQFRRIPYTNTEGAVLYVDILGIGELTKNKIEISRIDHYWYKDAYNNSQLLAFNLIMQFRNCLKDAEENFKNVKIEFLSDCAFIYSKSCLDLIDVAIHLMRNSLYSGVLLRGGMAYGDVMAPSSGDDMNNFVVGEAISNAVELESKPKGCRIFTNDTFLKKFHQEIRDRPKWLNGLFINIENPINFESYNEFLWFLYPYFDELKLLESIPFESRKSCAKDRYTMAGILKYSEYFAWNELNKKGKEHINSSLIVLTELYCDKVSVDYDFPDIDLKERGNYFERFRESIENDEIYKDLER